MLKRHGMHNYVLMCVIHAVPRIFSNNNIMVSDSMLYKTTLNYNTKQDDVSDHTNKKLMHACMCACIQSYCVN